MPQNKPRPIVYMEKNLHQCTFSILIDNINITVLYKVWNKTCELLCNPSNPYASRAELRVRCLQCINKRKCCSCNPPHLQTDRHNAYADSVRELNP